MKRCFTSLTALLCSAAILLCCLPMQALAAEFRMQTAYEDILPDELTAQEEAPAALAEPEAPEAEKQPEAPPEGRPSPSSPRITDPAILHTASCPTIPRAKQLASGAADSRCKRRQQISCAESCQCAHKTEDAELRICHAFGADVDLHVESHKVNLPKHTGEQGIQQMCTLMHEVVGSKCRQDPDVLPRPF